MSALPSLLEWSIALPWCTLMRTITRHPTSPSPETASTWKPWNLKEFRTAFMDGMIETHNVATNVCICLGNATPWFSLKPLCWPLPPGLWPLFWAPGLTGSASSHTIAHYPHVLYHAWYPGPHFEPRVLKHSFIWFIIKEYEVYDELSLFYILQWMRKSKSKPNQ